MTNFEGPTFRNQRNGLIVYGGVPPKSLDTWEQVYVTTEPPSGEQPASPAAASSEDHVDADTIPKEGTKRGSTNVPPPHANKER